MTPSTPVQFLLNGEERAELVPSATTLLQLLRDKVGDTTPKPGCLQGSCGACTVLVDGEPHLACITLAEDCSARNVETLAGLAVGGVLDRLQNAFIQAFASQCGFCTPGMIMAAKALLAHNPTPSREEVVDAISGNICRCTGYAPIIDAILSCAGQPPPETRFGELCFRKERFRAERRDDLVEVGQPRQRADVRGHVTGTSVFYGDRRFPDMLHLKMVRSPHHHARIRSIDTSAAESHPGVRRIIRAGDVPHNIYTILAFIGILPEDEPVLAFDKVRWKGEPIIAVLGTSERAAFEGAALVQVEYEPLPAVLDVEQAIHDESPLVNEYHGQNYYKYDSGNCRKVRLGDVAAGFRAADHIVEYRYQSSPIEQAPLETTGCVVAPDLDGRFTCYTSTQAMFFSLTNAAIILDVPESKLHFVGGTVGGGFGGKTDTVVEPIAILASMLSGRPVSYSFTRPEEMQVSSPRAAERIYIKDGVTADGRILARQVRCYVDAGAYSRHSPYGTNKAAAHFPGPYTIPNVSIDAYCIYTNRTPSSAMRGFGCTIGDFAIEVQMDRLAKLIGMDPIEFRLINAYRDGDMKAHHQPTEGAALVECLQEAAIIADWPISPRFARMSSQIREG